LTRCGKQKPEAYVYPARLHILMARWGMEQAENYQSCTPTREWHVCVHEIDGMHIHTS